MARSPDTRFTGATPFARLAMAHAASMSGDACLTVSLAGTIFFSATTGAARPRVLLYLALTMAPFALVAPLLGPALDRTRGGRRMMVVLSCIGRAVFCVFMARAVTKHGAEGLLLYPLAFGALVLAKTQAIAKSALVPALVPHHDELVEANSRLALISVVAAVAGGLPAAGIYKLFGSEWSLLFAAVVFTTGAVLGMKIPKAQRAARPETPLERAELHAPSILFAGTAMGVLRGVVGFLTFFAAFSLKRSHEGAAFFGIVLVASAVGGFVGVVAAPWLRRHVREEVILAGSLLGPAIIALVGARSSGQVAFVAVAASVAFGAAAGRVGFDSILQRDGPDHLRGRAFARFETRFQLTWVVGGLVAVVFLDLLNERVGFFLIALVLGFAGLSYLGGPRAAHDNVARPMRRVPGSERLERWRRGGVRRPVRGSGRPQHEPPPNDLPPAGAPARPDPPDTGKR